MTDEGATRERALVEAATPVRLIPTDDPDEKPKDGVALCLSGGGYRAMLFHVGSLWRLNELGWLARLDRVSSVSGGSITAGVLAVEWKRLDQEDRGVARNFREVVADRLHSLAGETIDKAAVVKGALLPGSAAARLVGSYDEHLFGGATLQDLPDRPRFVFNATNLQSGVLWRFSKPYMWDYRVGRIDAPTEPVAAAVAASSAFPPFLSPLRLELDPSRYAAGSGTDLQEPRYQSEPTLTDGGVYDNLGLETAWKRYKTILVSDGGGHFSASSRVRTLWPLQVRRVLGVIDSQVGALRKRQVIGGLRAGLRRGAYWGIWSEVDDFELADALDAPDEATKRLARVATRLARLDREWQERLVNWGYTICDTAMRRHVLVDEVRPGTLPYPRAGL